MVQCAIYSGLILVVIIRYKLIDIDNWETNSRGAGVMFGVKLVDKFLRANSFDKIVRAHQLILEGYKYLFMLLI